MSTLNSHIDPLQDALRNKFNDFEFDIDIDVNKVMEASNKANLASQTAGSQFKYWLGAGGIVTGIVITFLVFRNEKKSEVVAPEKNIIKIETKVEIDNTSKNETINLNTNKVKPTEIIGNNKKSNSVKRNFKSGQKFVTIDEISKDNEVAVPVTESREILEQPQQTEVESNNINTFGDFIKKKTKESKDSIQLFKKNK